MSPLKKSNPPPPDPEKMAIIGEMVRSLAVIVNTAIVYNHRHPVFKRAVANRLPDFQNAVNSCQGKFTLWFKDEKVVFQNIPLESRNEMFAKLAKLFADKGVEGITWQEQVQETELIDFIDILTHELGKTGLRLQESISQRGIANIREAVSGTRTEDVGADGRLLPKPPPEIKPEPVVRKPMPPPTRDRIFDLSLDEDIEEDAFQEETDSSSPFPTQQDILPRNITSQDIGVSEFRILCHEVIDDFDKGKTTKQAAAETMAMKFKQRLQTRVEEIRQETEVRVRRLENIKDIVMQELEQRDLAAVVISPKLHVLSMNRSARELLGDISELPAGSALAKFINSNQEKETIEIFGVYRQAHMIISDHNGTNSGAILVCLEPC